MKPEVLSKWFLTLSVILMMANAAMDYKDEEYLFMGLALIAALCGFMALIVGSRKRNN